jgi:hypothetical protein
VFGINAASSIKVDDLKVTPPARHLLKNSMKLVINHFKYFTDGFSINKDRHMHV